MVDYTKSVASVYVDLVLMLAKSTGSLFIDGTNGIGMRKATPRIENLPSWTPDLTKRSVSLAKFQRTLNSAADNYPAVQLHKSANPAL
jgi:hypothetical protein